MNAQLITKDLLQGNSVVKIGQDGTSQGGVSRERFRHFVAQSPFCCEQFRWENRCRIKFFWKGLSLFRKVHALEI